MFNSWEKLVEASEKFQINETPPEVDISLANKIFDEFIYFPVRQNSCIDWLSDYLENSLIGNRAKVAEIFCNKMTDMFIELNKFKPKS